MADPLVSVVLPTWNRAAMLREAVDSVFAQTLEDWELIVVDDGSTDGTREYLSTLPKDRIRVILHERCANPARLRNAALVVASGRYVALLDSDDLWDATKLERQLADMQRENARWSYSRVRWIDDRGAETPLPPGKRWQECRGWILHDLLAWNAWLALPAVIVDRETLRDVGGFDASLRFHEDFDLWLRLAGRYPITMTDAVLVSVRKHPGNTWRSDHLTTLHCFIEVYDRLIADDALRVERNTCLLRRSQLVPQLADAYRGQGRAREAVGLLLRGLPRGAVLRHWWSSLARSAYRWVLPRRPSS